MEPGTFSVNLSSIRTKGLSVNFADTGFGLSQVLPLIVQGLYDPADGLIIAEQPEIHLNPKLQGKLADLFVYMANSGKGVIVETHSEHLLLRLRRLIAEKKINTENVAIYFIEKEDDISTAKMIPIKDNGHIDPNLWPKGFFEDSLHEAFQLATIQSRSKYK